MAAAAAPIQGLVVPNRIFVGGIPSSASEAELNDLFSRYGNVRAVKIIMDRNGTSKGYGFVTYENDVEAERVLRLEGDIPMLRDRRLNVARAIKKTGPPNQNPNRFGHAGRMIPGPYQVLLQQPMYMPQYYAQVQGGYHQSFYNESQDVFQYSGVGNDYSESSDMSSESSKSYPKVSTASNSSDYESSGTNSPAPKACNQLSSYRLATNALQSPTMHHAPAYQLHHVMPKAAMAIMAYPSSIVMGTPTIVQLKDSTNNEQENVMTEFSYLHSPMQSPISSAPLTPPPTPWAPIPCDFGSNAESSCKN